MKVPTPDTEYRTHRVDSLRSYDQHMLTRHADIMHGDTIRYIPAGSYLNFLITNGRVFSPAYGQEGRSNSMKEKDERMRTILATCVRDRIIVQVDPRAINWRGGGVHCWTQQHPRSGEQAGAAR